MNIKPLQAPRASAPTPLGFLSRLFRAVLKLALGLVGFVLLLGALLVGLTLALGIVIWARLRGRQAAPGVFRAAFQQARRRTPMPVGEVVDVEVREVPEVSRTNTKP